MRAQFEKFDNAFRNFLDTVQRNKLNAEHLDFYDALLVNVILIRLSAEKNSINSELVNSAIDDLAAFALTYPAVAQQSKNMGNALSALNLEMNKTTALQSQLFATVIEPLPIDYDKLKENKGPRHR
ncbi:MAG: hypothetical protein A3E82_06460 [Gammaproteobacteria bacterium RIFCSPHIGHO2_12_FULL_38_11]|nr:MAG: hypothetical protein A3E82_06460 [Gammaproteobacteria bacterium RIFCSPHIGHO2_12_FULL_38_11]